MSILLGSSGVRQQSKWVRPAFIANRCWWNKACIPWATELAQMPMLGKLIQIRLVSLTATSRHSSVPSTLPLVLAISFQELDYRPLADARVWTALLVERKAPRLPRQLLGSDQELRRRKMVLNICANSNQYILHRSDCTSVRMANH